MTRVRALVAHGPVVPPDPWEPDGADRPPEPAGGAALRLEEIELPAVGSGDVRVRILAAGVCHSDLSMVNGTLVPPYPLVLGHEAAGVVTEVGAGVSRVEPGDRVVLNWSPPCRRCWFCAHGEPWLCEPAGSRGPAVPRGTTAAGEPLHVTLGLGALAEEVVVGEDAAVPVPAELPAEQAALLGCAVLTGVGAVRNTARVAAGDAVLVIGLGGVGLSALLGARQAGAAPIIAVDVSQAKRELALSAGATEYLVVPPAPTTPARSPLTVPGGRSAGGDPVPGGGSGGGGAVRGGGSGGGDAVRGGGSAGGDPVREMVKRVRGLTGGRGVDHAFECVGRSGTIEAAWRATRRGGQVTVVGMGAHDDVVRLSALDVFHSARVLRSSVYGAADPDRDVPLLVRAVLAGELALGPLITHRSALDGAPAALARMARGEGARSVILFD